jgi:tetratricopeptide (TPR) repeat protein
MKRLLVCLLLVGVVGCGKNTGAIAKYDEGNVFAEQEDLNTAIACYTEAIQLEPDYAEAYYRRGVAHGQLDTPRRSHENEIADYTKAIELKPDLAEAYIGRGVAFYNTGFPTGRLDEKGDFFRDDSLTDTYYSKAIADFTEAIRLDPENDDGYFHRGMTYHAQDEYAKAIADYTEAIRLDPQYVVNYYMRGITYHAQDEYAKAIADYTEAIRLYPKFAVGYHKRGSAYQKLGNEAKAKADFDKAKELGYERYEND